MSHGLTEFLGIHLFDGAGAVWTFFAISGFLITIALSEKYRFGNHHLFHFYWNRAIRLYPAYLFWLCLTIAAYSIIPANLLTYQRFVVDSSIQASGFWVDHAPNSSVGTLFVAILANFTGLFSDALLYLGLDRATGSLIANPSQDAAVWAMGFMFIGQFWSIGVELCFYAIAPLICQSLPRIGLLFLLSVSGYLEKFWISLGGLANLPPSITYLQAPKFMWMFMVGSALGHIYLNIKKANSDRNIWLSLVTVLFMYGCIFFRESILFPLQNFPWWIFVMLTLAIPILFSKTSSNKYDRFAGDLSYPVYVNHFILIQIMGSQFVPNGFAFALASILLAALTIFLVERPAKRLKF